MECQVDKSEHFRHLLLFAFNQGNKAAKAARDICAVYGEYAMNERTARRWFSRGVSFNNDVELRTWLDEFFESRPNAFYRRGIKKLVERWQEVVNNEGEYIID